MKKQFLLAFILFVNSVAVFAQGGGPPMITDDPGTPDKNSWEINLSHISEISNVEREYAIPQIDINYGLNERTQLKAEIAFLQLKEENEIAETLFGNLKLGIKYRFIDEETSAVALSVYPQIGIDISGDGFNSYIFPMQIEKTFGNLVVGTDLGYVYIKDNYDYFFNGFIFGYGISENFEMMTEFNYLIPRDNISNIVATVGLGSRIKISDTFVIISSIATGVVTPKDEPNTDLILFLGLQINL